MEYISPGVIVNNEYFSKYLIYPLIFRKCVLGTGSNFFSVVINAMTKSNLGRKGFIWLILPDHSPSLRELRVGAQDRN